MSPFWICRRFRCFRCRRFRSVAVLACRRFGCVAIFVVAVLDVSPFSLSPFWIVAVLTGTLWDEHPTFPFQVLLLYYIPFSLCPLHIAVPSMLYIALLDNWKHYKAFYRMFYLRVFFLVSAFAEIKNGTNNHYKTPHEILMN